MNEDNKNSPLKNELLEKLIEIFSEDLNETKSGIGKKAKFYNIIEATIVFIYTLLIIGLWFILYKLII